MEKTEKQPIYQLPNGKWQHIKSRIEWSDKISAATDYRFCCEWERRQ